MAHAAGPEVKVGSDVDVSYLADVAAFADGNGDGIGDITGLIDHLGYLELLGVTALRLHPSAAADDRAAAAIPAAALSAHGLRLLGRPPNPPVANLSTRPFRADALSDFIRTVLAAGPACWAISTAELGRAASRWGGGGIGLRRARAGLLIMFALPGDTQLLYGDELGLADTRRGGPRQMPWSAPDTSDDTTLPAYAEDAESQLELPGSTLNLTRAAVELRLHSQRPSPERVEWFGAPADSFAFRSRGGGMTCVVNTGSRPVMLPPGEPVLVSTPLLGGALPGDAAAWLSAG